MKAPAVSAFLIFVMAFCLRIPLVDTYYPYSFEPDSEPCVEVTRSFYFFFKSPCTENFPQTLSHYPNYSDGDFIASALVANMVRPLCKAGVITAPLADGDNSLVIFSMRWSGVLFDALAAALAFLVFVVLTGNLAISLLITLLYYLLNIQTLNIDLIRIDHFGLLAANLVMLSTLLLFKWPGKKRYYLLAGVSAGLLTGTKLNFPFYLLPLVFATGYFMYTRKISFKNFLILAASAMFTTAFMYQRWLMYPENISEALVFTLNNGKVWTEFWGNNNYSYYLWDEFFNHGYNLAMGSLLVCGYLSCVLFFCAGVFKSDPLKLVLITTFVLQSVALMFSPKIGRYGIIMPVWVGIFLAYGACLILQYLRTKPAKGMWQFAFGLFLIPGACYAWKDYNGVKENCGRRAESIQQTRVESYKWLLKNMEPGSICAIQHPRSGNVPVSDLPYVGEEKFLTCPFLFKEQVANFFPPDMDSLKNEVNYIISSDKETNYTYDIINNYHFDSSLLHRWMAFYSSLDTLFPHYDFSSPYANYGVKSIHIYKVKDTLTWLVPGIIDCSSTSGGLCWKLTHVKPGTDYDYQVQIAEDSSFRWLVMGSRDGFESKYRHSENPAPHFGQKESFIPPRIADAILAGKFGQIMNGSDPKDVRVQQGIQKFFWQVLVLMSDSDMSLQNSLATLMKNGDDKIMAGVINSLYTNTPNILVCHTADYIRQAGLAVDTNTMANLHTLQFSFNAPAQLKKGIRYFWRVRLRNQYNVTSRWSDVRALML